MPYTHAHPPGILRGMVISQLKRYWKENTFTDDYQKYFEIFYKWLRDRRYHHRNLSPVFVKASKNIDKNMEISTIEEATRQLPNNAAIFHLTRHPDRVKNKDIQCAYSNNFNVGTRRERVGITNPYNIKL